MSKLVVGLMSGTSCDGADAALLRTDGESQIDFLGGVTLPYESDIRSRLLDASQHDVPLTEVLRLEEQVSEYHVRAVRLLQETEKAAADIELVGFHGHTLRHVPKKGRTFQIGNPWILARDLGVPVVHDFRRNDMAYGGQGAPLVSVFHRALFLADEHPLVVLNIGGVANVTWLGEGGEIIGGDTGPGCGLMDEWAQTTADLPHDRDGQLAAAGTVDWPSVEEALSADYFALPLPKSADRYDFDHVDVSHLSTEDGAATLCAVTAEAVYRAVKRLPAMPKKIWATGGGVHHPVLMQMLAERFGSVGDVKERGLNPDTLEAECFAWLAVRHTEGLPLTVPETTGVSKPLPGACLTSPV